MTSRIKRFVRLLVCHFTKNCEPGRQLDRGIRVGVGRSEALDVLRCISTLSVTFSGPLVDNEHWPVLTVSRYDSDFYSVRCKRLAASRAFRRLMEWRGGTCAGFAVKV